MFALNSAEFVIRAPTTADIPGILGLMNAYDLATIGHPYTAPRSLLNDWRWSGFDLMEDARLVIDKQGQIVGYECILGFGPHQTVETDGCVHPDYAGRGIGTYLLRWAEARARARLSELSAKQGGALQAGTFGNDARSQKLFEAEGYEVVRHFWRMEIDLSETLPIKWPTGITVRTYIPGKDEFQTWQAMNEIFLTEWDYVALPFEEWLVAKVPADDLEPSLWFLAMDGEQIVGMSRGIYRQDEGWIRTFGVRSAWRKRGIALALIHHSFNEFYRRGKTNVGLGVDSENQTGATLFYERAGMHPTLTFDTYQKRLPVEPQRDAQPC